MSLRIVDPVVVMPDMDSKIESLKLILRFAKKKGRDPKIQIKNPEKSIKKIKKIYTRHGTAAGGTAAGGRVYIFDFFMIFLDFFLFLDFFNENL